MAAVLTGFLLAGSAHAFDWSSFPPMQFTIYDANGKRMVGHSFYRIEQDAGSYIIHGENHYLDGEYDIEIDRLSPGAGKRLPRLLNFSHCFYKRDGSVRLLGELNLASGQGTCATYDPKAQKFTAHLECPLDTSAGAALLIPIMEAFKSGRRSPLPLHVFDCAPQPKVLAVTVQANAKDHRWPLYPGHLVEIEVAPNLGWWNVLLGPFLPRVRAWFDPAQNWGYVGGRIHHYFYRGPEVQLVKTHARPEHSGGRAASSADVNGSAKDASQSLRAGANASRRVQAPQPLADGADQK